MGDEKLREAIVKEERELREAFQRFSERLQKIILGDIERQKKSREAVFPPVGGAK